jgi:hypothetical protein
MVIIAGLAVYGTEAAGRIVSDPKLLEPVLGSFAQGLVQPQPRDGDEG